MNSPAHPSLPSTEGRGERRTRSLPFSGLTRLFLSSQGSAAATGTPQTPPPPLGPQTARGGAGLCGRGSSSRQRRKGESQHSSSTSHQCSRWIWERVALNQSQGCLKARSIVYNPEPKIAAMWKITARAAGKLKLAQGMAGEELLPSSSSGRGNGDP